VPSLVKQLDLASSKAPNIKLIPALSALMGAIKSDERQKTVQTEILQRMRHENVHVRVAAIETQVKLYEAHEEAMVGMLPQSIPFISEAMEDEDEDVVRALHKLIYIIEDKIGESLQGYLTL